MKGEIKTTGLCLQLPSYNYMYPCSQSLPGIGGAMKSVVSYDLGIKGVWVGMQANPQKVPSTSSTHTPMA